MSDIGELKKIIRETHHAKAKHIESVPVTEMFRGEVVWDGVVEVFHLKGHPETDKVYAWSRDLVGNAKQYVTVLHLPPALSPAEAVRVSIVQEYRHAQPV
jgi:hypothetical protein